MPWFPSKHPRFGEYAVMAQVPHAEERNGIKVLHPRYPLIPKIGMSLSPFFLAAAAYPSVRKIWNSGYRFDVIDAHYFYPDGVAAALLANRLGVPFAITARGTDINLIPRHRVPRRLIQWAATQASALVTVCQALKDALVDMNVSADKITVLRNGVDLERFRPQAREALRAELKLSGPTLLSVGHLVERKGHHIVIEVLARLKGVTLLIAGDGEERVALGSLANSLGVADRIRFLGAVPQTELLRYYSAADALVLASSREGWANVLLEAMACGTPVIATRVWGTPEVVAAPEAGVLMRDRNAESLFDAYNELERNYPDRAETRRYAERFSWDDTTQGQLEIFQRILAARIAERKA